MTEEVDFYYEKILIRSCFLVLIEYEIALHIARIWFFFSILLNFYPDTTIILNITHAEGYMS